MKKSAVLTDKQAAYVDKILTGSTKYEAAKETCGSSHSVPERSAAVRQHLAEARAGITQATTLTRLDVIDGILDAIQMARTMAEPATMIAGYTNLARIMGFNAPEVKKLELTVGGQHIRSKMEIMSDEELLALAEGRPLIEGVYQHVS